MFQVRNLCARSVKCFSELRALREAGSRERQIKTVTRLTPAIRLPGGAQFWVALVGSDS